MNEEILTVEEAAQMMRVTRATINNWIKSGNLPAFKTGMTVRIKKSDIEEMFKRGENVAK